MQRRQLVCPLQTLGERHSVGQHGVGVEPVSTGDELDRVDSPQGKAFHGALAGQGVVVETNPTRREPVADLRGDRVPGQQQVTRLAEPG